MILICQVDEALMGTRIIISLALKSSPAERARKRALVWCQRLKINVAQVEVFISASMDDGEAKLLESMDKVTKWKNIKKKARERSH